MKLTFPNQIALKPIILSILKNFEIIEKDSRYSECF